MTTQALPHILFVDDQDNVLQGLRRMLRNMQKQWRMSFANGGDAALDVLGKDPVSVIVTDMRMPGMDGAQLLSRVEQISPATIRIVLSGQFDQETAFRAVQSAHQFLSKPCDSSTIIRTVARSLKLRNMLRNSELQVLVTGLRTLPTLPEVYQDLMTELESPTSSTKSIGAVISRDVSLTAKLLQWTNSAYFGVQTKATTPSQAVALLGTEVIRALVMKKALADLVDTTNLERFRMKDVIDHGLRVGYAAQHLAKREGCSGPMTGLAFSAGLLHVTGMIVLAVNDPDRYHAVVQDAVARKRPFHVVEREIFNVTSAETGAYLLGLWGMPDVVVEAVALRQEPRLIGDDPQAQTDHEDILPYLHVASALLEGEDPYTCCALDTDYLTAVGLDGKLEGWRTAIEEQGHDA